MIHVILEDGLYKIVNYDGTVIEKKTLHECADWISVNHNKGFKVYLKKYNDLEPLITDYIKAHIHKTTDHLMHHIS